MADDVKILPSTDSSAATIAADDDGGGRLFQLVRTDEDRKIQEQMLAELRMIRNLLSMMRDAGIPSSASDDLNLGDIGSKS